MTLWVLKHLIRYTSSCLALLCYKKKNHALLLVAQILGDASKAPSGPVEKQCENLIAKIGFDVGQAINSFSPELGGRQGG